MKTLQEIKTIAEQFIKENGFKIIGYYDESDYMIYGERCELEYEVETCKNNKIDTKCFIELKYAYEWLKKEAKCLNSNSINEPNCDSITFRFHIKTENSDKAINLDFLS